MVMTRAAGLRITRAVAVTTVAVAAFATLWWAPQSLGVDTLSAYQLYGDAGTTAIVLFGLTWLVIAVGVVCVVHVRMKRSDAWCRGGRHRYISVIGCSLMVYGVIAASSWLPYAEVTLAAEHVQGWQEQDRSFWILPGLVSMTGATAVVVALALGFTGMLVDRLKGKSFFLTDA